MSVENSVRPVNEIFTRLGISIEEPTGEYGFFMVEVIRGENGKSEVHTVPVINAFGTGEVDLRSRASRESNENKLYQAYLQAIQESMTRNTSTPVFAFRWGTWGVAHFQINPHAFSERQKLTVRVRSEEYKGKVKPPAEDPIIASDINPNCDWLYLRGSSVLKASRPDMLPGEESAELIGLDSDGNPLAVVMRFCNPGKPIETK